MPNLRVWLKDQFKCIAPAARPANALTATRSLPHPAWPMQRACPVPPCGTDAIKATQGRPPYGTGSHCATWAPMRLADPWACFPVMAWLALCSLLLSACTGTSPQAQRRLGLSVQKTRPQIDRPAARTARAVPTAAAVVTDAGEKERLFRGFVEWQGAQDAAR